MDRAPASDLMAGPPASDQMGRAPASDRMGRPPASDRMVRAPASDRMGRAPASDRMDLHFQILGWLFIGSAVLTGTLSVAVFIFGRFLPEIPLPVLPTALGPDVEGLITLVITILGVLMALTAAVSVAAGIGILQYQTWGRVMGLTAASLIITKIPIGTAVGIYAFWVLLSKDGRQHFRARAPQPTR